MVVLGLPECIAIVWRQDVAVVLVGAGAAWKQ